MAELVDFERSERGECGPRATRFEPATWVDRIPDWTDLAIFLVSAPALVIALISIAAWISP